MLEPGRRKHRCVRCLRARWRKHKAKYGRYPKVKLGPVEREDPRTIERRYQRALRVIRQQRWSVDLAWKSQAAFVVEAA